MHAIDTSCFIYILRIGKLDILRSLFSKIYITQDVMKEIENGTEGVTELKENVNEWIFIEDADNKLAIDALSKNEKIEYADASLILLAKQKKDLLVSNDAALIRIARIKGVACWWFTRCIIESLKRKIIKKKEAKNILVALVKNGMYLDNRVYAVLLDEIDKL